jgi:hypothetical protein
MGIFGGVDPLIDFTGSPPIPQIVDMNIINCSVPLGGTLNVQIKANSHK